VSTLFVTGSGTGVGKTLVTQLIVTALRRRRRNVHALKPIVSGFDACAPEVSDTAQLLDALGMTLDAPNLDAVSPWRFAEPLSPDMAARREGRTIPFDELVAFCARHTGDTTTVIEGVGGVMVPLDESHTVIDWIAAVACPTVLVTGSYLGAISHTLTAIETLSTRHVEIRAIIVSESAEQPVPLAETAETIARYAGGTAVTMLPRLSRGTQAPDLAAALDL
jgi:dethiobiotin synthetase